MKKSLLLISILLIALSVSAQSFVMIKTQSQQETENLFKDSNLKIHYYNDNFVLATANVVDKSMKMLDLKAFDVNNSYFIVYCDRENQKNYLSKVKAEALFADENILIFKDKVMPFKNDGMIAVFDKEAKLPVAHRDFPVVTAENAIIREMMNQVNMDSMHATVQHLQDYGSRFFSSETAFAASDWVAGRMEALGLEVEQQGFYVNSWVGSGQAAPNVIGIQRGTLYPDVYVVCGSHFDSFTWDVLYGGNNAPGADDNATGVASVLESARIMTQYEFDYSIIYCAYGAEEEGLYGSEAYASRCQQQGMQILGYFNNDMNGYLNPGDPIHIDLIYPNSVAPIGDYYMNVANVYFPELPVRHVNFEEGDSDHTSFNQHGYQGIYPFEDYQNYSPYIHTTSDIIGTSVNSWEMSQQYCRMNIGCLAEIAHPVGSGPVIYCNPVENFEAEYPYFDDYASLRLTWMEPLAGSTGALVSYKVYRNNELASEVTDLEYVDSIGENESVEYHVTAVYDDGCEATSETLTVNSVLGIPEIDTLNEEVVRYEVYDLMGRRVNDLKSGIYMIKYFMKNGNVITKKIIKK